MIRINVQLWCMVHKPIHRIKPPIPKAIFLYFILAIAMQHDFVEQKEGACQLSAMH